MEIVFLILILFEKRSSYGILFLNPSNAFILSLSTRIISSPSSNALDFYTSPDRADSQRSKQSFLSRAQFLNTTKMSVLSRLSPTKTILLAATLIVARKLKAGTNRTRFLLSVLLGYIVYTKKAPPVIEGADPPGNIKAYPWIGHLYMYQTVKDHMHETILRISRDTNFKSYSISLPDNFRMLVLHDEEDRKYLLRTQFTNFNKNFDEKFGFDKVSIEIVLCL